MPGDKSTVTRIDVHRDTVRKFECKDSGEKKYILKITIDKSLGKKDGYGASGLPSWDIQKSGPGRTSAKMLADFQKITQRRSSVKVNRHRRARHDKTVLSVSRPLRRRELNSRQLETVADRECEVRTRSVRAIVQFTSPRPTRQRQDCLVVSGGRCEFGQWKGCAVVCSDVSNSLMGLLQLRYEHDSSTIRLRFDYDSATTRYEVFRALAYEIVYENQW